MGLILARQEKLRRSFGRLFQVVVLAFCISNVKMANADSPSIFNNCSTVEEAVDGINLIPADNVCVLHSDYNIEISLKIFNVSSLDIIFDEVTRLNFRKLRLFFESEIDLERSDFKRLKNIERLVLGFSTPNSLSMDNFAEMDRLRSLILDSPKGITILHANSGKLVSLANLSSIDISWEGDLQIKDRAFVGLPSLQDINLFGQRIVNTERAAFTGVVKINFLPANIDEQESSGGTWD